MKYIYKIILFIAISFTGFANAMQTEQAQVNLVAGNYNNGLANLGLHYKINPDWTIYWRSAGDTGYPPQLNWEGSKNIKSAKILWPIPKRHSYELMEGFYSESYVYINEVLFPIEITAEDPSKPIEAKLYVDFAICHEICISDNAEFKLDIPVGYNSTKNKSLIEKYKNLVPKANGSSGLEINQISTFKQDDKQFLQVNVKTKYAAKDVEIFIEGGEDFAFYKPEILSSKSNKVTFKVPVTNLTDKKISERDFTITVASDVGSVEKTISGNEIKTTEAPKNALHSYWLILLFGFIGGLILNVMPCVLPVLSIKLMGVIKYGGGSKAQVARGFIVTALGIVCSFLALSGIIIALKSVGMNVGWGFHFQEPIFIIFLIVILTFFAANMWGLYEFRLPFSIGGKAYKKSEEHSMAGHFLMGVFATILATPCTAPFLGTAVGFAFAGDNLEIISVFAAMGIGMSSPYLLFSFYPELVTKLPKPGNWMVAIKHVMGWLLAATAIWLIWVLSGQLGAFAAFILLGLSIIKIIKLWAANYVAFLSRKFVRIIILTAIIILSFTLPLKLSEVGFKKNIAATDMWEEFEESHINLLVENGKIVFVDVTADWCLTCKVNKFFVLDSKEVKQQFYKLDVVAMRADWTNKNSDIAEYLMRNNRVGIPFNIVYGPGAPQGIALSELLTKSEIFKALQEAGQ